MKSKDIDSNQLSFFDMLKEQESKKTESKQKKSRADIGTRFVFYDGAPDNWGLSGQELLGILLSGAGTEFTIVHWSDDVDTYGGPDRHTYRIVRGSDDWWHIEVLYGPDNETDYRTMAVVKFSLIYSPPDPLDKDSDADIYSYDYAIKAIRVDNESRPMYMDIIRLLSFCVGKAKNLFLHEMFLSRRCRYCHRLLTTPESIVRGYGPKCAKKHEEVI